MEQPPLFGSGYQCENPDCGAPIHPDNHGHIAKHCNERCRCAAYHAANRDKVAARAARYRAANPEKIAAMHALYHVANRDKVAAKSRRRRARKAGGVPQRWRKREDVPETLCYWCGVDLKDAPKHLDHIMPISLGGPATPSNEAMTCPPCNLQKSDKHPLVWIAQLVASTQPTEGKAR